jgi:tetratricopeptide (TPR) repeat protein
MTERTAPEIRQIPVKDVDTSVLPPRARVPGTEAFQTAVITHFASHYAGKGWNAAVTSDDEFIRIVAVPETGVEPKEYVLGLLQHGFLSDALPLLEILDDMLDDPDIAYNHGVCLGELRRVADSIPVLQRCIHLDPYHTDAHVALGVANARSGDNEAAAVNLRTAIEQQPDNVFAVRNLAAVLGNLDRHAEALPLFRQAAEASLDDPLLQLGLAQCLEHAGSKEAKEAVRIFKRIDQDYPDHPAADAARAALNRMGAQELHDRVGGQPRLDAVMYMQNALETFAKMPRQQVGEIVMEIAQLGQSGLAINEPDKRYTLKRLPGDYSGLQLVSMMHVGFRMFDPNTDPETGLEHEYQMALSMGGDAK